MIDERVKKRKENNGKLNWKLSGLSGRAVIVAPTVNGHRSRSIGLRLRTEITARLIPMFNAPHRFSAIFILLNIIKCQKNES